MLIGSPPRVQLQCFCSQQLERAWPSDPTFLFDKDEFVLFLDTLGFNQNRVCINNEPLVKHKSAVALALNHTISSFEQLEHVLAKVRAGHVVVFVVTDLKRRILLVILVAYFQIKFGYTVSKLHSGDPNIYR